MSCYQIAFDVLSIDIEVIVMKSLYLGICIVVCVCMCVCVWVAQLCQTICHPMDYSLPGFSVHGILQARILEWIAIPFSRGTSNLRDWTLVSCITGWFFTIWATGKSYCVVGIEQLKDFWWSCCQLVFFNLLTFPKPIDSLWQMQLRESSVYSKH